MRASRELLGVAVAAAVGLSGCGSSARDQVHSKVEQLVTAVGKRDYKTICQQVLAKTLLEHLAAGGIQCEQAMQIGLQDVSGPALAIGRIDVHGSTASVVTITAAKDQAASLDAIELAKTSSGWRVTGLGTPVFPGGKRSAAPSSKTTAPAKNK